MIQYLCDLCGKPIKSEGRRFKIKELKSRWPDRYWVKLLAHDECVKAIATAATAIYAERDEDDAD